MTPFDRQVRAQVFQLLLAGARVVDAGSVAQSRGWGIEEVSASLGRLEAEHRLALVPQTDRVAMAHPFSGVETSYRSVIGARWWYANCAWDSLALLALLGDGTAHGDEAGVEWSVENGMVSPNGLIHMLVPARRFWDDVAYT